MCNDTRDHVVPAIGGRAPAVSGEVETGLGFISPSLAKPTGKWYHRAGKLTADCPWSPEYAHEGAALLDNSSFLNMQRPAVRHIS